MQPNATHDLQSLGRDLAEAEAWTRRDEAENDAWRRYNVARHCEPRGIHAFSILRVDPDVLDRIERVLREANEDEAWNRHAVAARAEANGLAGFAFAMNLGPHSASQLAENLRAQADHDAWRRYNAPIRLSAPLARRILDALASAEVCLVDPTAGYHSPTLPDEIGECRDALSEAIDAHCACAAS